jgi:hypothetical protein
MAGRLWAAALLAAAAAAAGVEPGPPPAGSCTPVRRAATPLPDDAAGWGALLVQPSPVVFPASGSLSSALLVVTEGWTWDAIGKGLGPHVQAFVGEEGQAGFPYFEQQMPLESVPAKRRLDRRASSMMMSGAELVDRLLHRNTTAQPDHLTYASQSMLRLNGGEVDPRAERAGPQPPMGTELRSAMQTLSAASNTSMASAALWLASAGAATPLHYDTSHNVYVQLHGRKRARLLPPSAAAKARLFPSLHPGYRQSQLDISEPGLRELSEAAAAAGGSGGGATKVKVAAAAASLRAEAIEVVLSPGDVLVLPPYWLHAMEALGGEAEEEGGEQTAAAASLAWWVTAEAFQTQEEAYKIRVPFAAAWGLGQRVSAVGGMLREVVSAAGLELPALRASLRSRYQGLYRSQPPPLLAEGTEVGLPEGLCGSSSSSSQLDALFPEGGGSGAWAAAISPSVDQMASVLLRQEPPSLRPLHLANYAEHLLMWCLGPLRPAAAAASGAATGIAPEAAWLPVLVLQCTPQLLGDAPDGR